MKKEKKEGIDERTGLNSAEMEIDFPLEPYFPVQVKKCGNIYEIRAMAINRKGCPIEKISAHHYRDRHGEIKEFRHTDSRADNKASVARTLRNLRDIINSNVVRAENVLWVTLTYAENMKQADRLFYDYKKFWKQFQRYLNKRGILSVEYIAAAEPQARGAWHLHCIFLFEEKAPFIPNDDIAGIWSHGFTKTKRLDDVDNIGLYLTAYLGDMEFTEAMTSGKRQGKLVGVTARDENGEWQSKAVIKGARLSLYPRGFRMFRTSRGIRRPEIIHTTEEDAQELVADMPMVYEKIISPVDSDGIVRNKIYYRQYNAMYRGGNTK